jgi:hypothetical protein
MWLGNYPTLHTISIGYSTVCLLVAPAMLILANALLALPTGRRPVN